MSTGIEWTDETWNPVTGCTKVSSGCEHCYAERITERFHGKGSFATVQLHPQRLTKPLRWRRPRRVFVNSMSDLFHPAVNDEFIARVFAVMAATPWHTYQILTKRHARMRSVLRDECRCGSGHPAGVHLLSAMEWAATPHNPDSVPGLTTDAVREGAAGYSWGRPLPNVWLGVSAEDQATANLRVPALLETPATVRFVSAEPLLGPVDLTSLQRQPDHTGRIDALAGDVWEWPSGAIYAAAPGCVDWVIAGGESGPGARPMQPGWVRALRDQTTAAGRAFLFKQWGEWAPAGYGLGCTDPRERLVGPPISGPPAAPAGHRGFEVIRRVGKKTAGRVLDGRVWDQFPPATGWPQVGGGR